MEALTKIEQLNAKLGDYTGTERYFRHPTSGLMFTDGIKAMADTAGAYWLIDEALHHIKYEAELQDAEVRAFILVRLKIESHSNGSNFGVITLEDGNGKIYKQKQISFTDFPVGEFRMFFCDKVLMLTGEY